MQLVAEDGVAWSVCLSVSLSVCHKNNNSATAGLADHDLARAKNKYYRKEDPYLQSEANFVSSIFAGKLAKHFRRSSCTLFCTCIAI